MALSNYTTTSFTSNGSVDIPANAQDITVEMRGSKGSSGQSGGGGAGSGGNGRQGKFSLPNYQERTLSFTFKDGGAKGGGGTWSEQVTVPATCNATSNISANWSSNGVLKVSGAGHANITINQSTNDNPDTAGTSFTNANINSNYNSSSASFTFNNGNFSDSARFQAGDVQFNINGLQKPLQRFNNNQCLSLRDGDGNDTNTSFCIGTIDQKTYSYDCSYYVTNNYTGYDGGKGGKAAIMSDSYAGGILAVAGGGGGGGGGHTKNSKSGGSGNAAASFGAAAISSTCNGSAGATDNQGGGGGGGAGVCPDAAGGSGGTPNGSGGTGGNGGISAYNSSYISITQNTTTSDANPSASVKYRTITPEIDSFTTSKSTMINDGTDGITLKWSTTDAIDVDLKGNNNNDPTYGTSYVDVAVDNTSGTFRQPTDDIQYTLRACTYGDVCVTQSVFITVYQLPTSNFYALDPEITIGTGGTTLEWQLTGDGLSAEIDQGIGAILATGSQAINPSQTTTYTLSLTSLGGDLTDSVTVKVFQIPQLQVSYPSNVDYDLDFDIDVKTKYCNNGVTMTVTQFYFGTDGGLTGDVIDIVYDLGADGSAEFQTDFRQIVQTVSPAWNDLGPYRLDIAISAGGSGGVKNDSKTFMVVIDLMPDPVVIPENSDEIPETDPVVSPDETKSGFVGSPVIPITGVDIPVEIRADKPIRVRFDPDDPNNESSWKKVRQYSP